jgi:hypothetical protein
MQGYLEELILDRRGTGCGRHPHAAPQLITRGRVRADHDLQNPRVARDGRRGWVEATLVLMLDAGVSGRSDAEVTAFRRAAVDGRHAQSSAHTPAVRTDHLLRGAPEQAADARELRGQSREHLFLAALG